MDFLTLGILIGLIGGVLLAALWVLVARLSPDKRKRHDHKTLHGIQDASALLVDLIVRTQAEKAYSDQVIRQTLNILGKVSEGPHRYEDSPSCKDQLDANARRELQRWLIKAAEELGDAE